MPRGMVTIGYVHDKLIEGGDLVDEMQEYTNVDFDDVSWHIHDLGFSLAIE